MKAVLRIVTLVLLVSFIAGCAQPTEAPVVEPPAAEAPAAPEAPAATEAPVVEEVLDPKDEWLKTNQLGPYYTDEQDWAAIEAAAIAEGELLVYANSSKIESSAEAFMEKYPGIKVQAFDLGGDDVLLKTLEEQKAGAFTGDVW